jgi:hypothetical protein
MVIANADAVRPGVMEGGVKVAVAPGGNPRALNTTGTSMGASIA